MVERIEEDGKFRLDPLGGIQPWRYGEGPFDLAALDEAAQTTLLRPIPGRPGQVNVGAPEKVADVPPAR